MSTNSAIGRSKMPRAFVTTTSEAESSSNSSESTPAAAAWIHFRLSACPNSLRSAFEKKSQRRRTSVPGRAGGAQLVGLDDPQLDVLLSTEISELVRNLQSQGR